MIAVAWTAISILAASLIGLGLLIIQQTGQLRTEMGQLRTEMGQLRTETGQVRTEMSNQTNRIDQVIMNMATKDDIANLKTELRDTKTELKADIHRVEDKLDEHLHQHGPTPTRQTA